MKKPRPFSRYIFMTLLVLESLTLVVVIGVLHAMLVRSMDREHEIETSAQIGDIRLFLKDRNEAVQTRLEEISANSGIKVALMLGMTDKVNELVATLYPPANGTTYYIRSRSNTWIPQPPEAHRFLNALAKKGTLPPGKHTPGTQPTISVSSRSILRKGEPMGQVISVYDLAADPYCQKVLKTRKNCALFKFKANGLIDINKGRRIAIPADQKIQLLSGAPKIQVAHTLIKPLAGFPKIYLGIDNLSFQAKKRSLLVKIIWLCLPLLGLALTASFMIIQKVTLPLNALSEDAMQIAQGSFDHYLDEKKIRHIEFLNVSQAFNKALMLIRYKKEKLQRLNQSLQDEIAERKQLTAALADSEAQFRSLQDNIPMGLFRSTLKGRLHYANPACLKIMGYHDLEEFKTINTNTLYETREDHLAAMRRLAKNEIIESMQVRMKRSDGTIFWALLHMKKVMDTRSGETYLDGTLQDISLQIKAENEKRQLEADLRQAQKMETIGTLAGGIAHDFNNLLASIMGFSELALEDSIPDSIQAENLKCVLIAGQRAADLVGQILTFARKTDTKREPIQAHLVIQEAMKLIRSTTPSTIMIHECIQSRSTIMAAPTQLHQVIINLCTNASHAMAESGGELTIQLSDVVLDATHVDPNRPVSTGPHIRLSVSDTGHGIRPDIKDRIFEPYFTTKTVGKGTGIGLSVVHGIVRSHGGFITLDSRPGEGTRFDIYLPIVDRKNIPQVMPETEIAGGKERILLVDDDELIMKMGHQMLEKLGYSVTSIFDSEQALDLFKNDSDHFDLVITDMTMPKLTGDRLAKAITAIRPETPVILYTGYSNRLDQLDINASGIRAVLSKPLVKNELADTIRTLLAPRQAHLSIQ